MRKLLVVLVICGVVGLATPRLYAACGGSTPMNDTSAAELCQDNAPVAAFAWQNSSPTTVTTDTFKIACEAFDGSACLGTVGVMGDGIIDIETDWANTGILGCPVVGTTINRVTVSIQGNDGQGALISVSGNDDVDFGYNLDLAHPFDAGSGTVLNIPCTNANGRPNVTSVTSSSVALRFNKPHIFNDCEPGSLGNFLDSSGAVSKPICPVPFDGTTNVALGGIYTSTQLCGFRPDVRRSQAGLWTLNAATPDANGAATIPYTAPAGPFFCSNAPTVQCTGSSTGNPACPGGTCQTKCLFVGGTVRIDGVESNSITGFVQVAGVLAPAPQALNVRAAFANGKVNVSFQTDSEVGLARINVLTDQKGGKGTVNVGSIALRGVGGSGASYTASYGKSEFKSGNTVIIELVTTDGRTTRGQASF